jgi:hypothetical protein
VVVVPARAAAGWVTVPEAVVVQPLASVMVTLYVPAITFVRSSVVAPLLHRYVYGAVPPVTVRLTPPVASPKQRTAVVVVDPASAAAGWVTVTRSCCCTTVGIGDSNIVCTGYNICKVFGCSSVTPQIGVWCCAAGDGKVNTSRCIAKAEDCRCGGRAGKCCCRLGYCTRSCCGTTVASVMVTLYVPAITFVRSSVVAPLLHR